MLETFIIDAFSNPCVFSEETNALVITNVD